MTKKVAITGMGIISSIGNTIEENYVALINKKAGISNLELIKSNHSAIIKVGEIKFTNKELAQILELPYSNNYSRATMLAEIAAKEAVKNAQIDNINEYKTGLISSTSVGGMDMTEKFYTSQFLEATNRKYITSHDAGDMASKVAKNLGIEGFVTTISTACSSSANAILLGVRMINSGKLDRVIVGGSDCLSKFTINGFNSLMILSDEDCKPFDKNRKGLNLGEAAAYIVLESDEIISKEKKQVLAYVSGGANANDAFHQTASSENGEGATLAMEEALKKANLKASDINYINAHGTATTNNDSSESRAIINVFGKNLPKISSTKAFTGHTLAAAAAIEAVYSILAIKNDVIFPNLNFQEPIEDTLINPITKVVHERVDHVLSNSFGFGGNCSTLIFSKE